MTTDKIESHYFQQLSALMDGDLAPDQARFLLRRMQHDTDLTACLERWQLCGDALRGHAQAPAPAGFAARIAAAIVQEPAQAFPNGASGRRRGTLARWGGGALAASVAAFALFMVRQQVPDDGPAQASPAVAGQSPVAATTPALASPAVQATTVTSASVAVASVPRRQVEASRRSATRSQQAARNAATMRKVPDRAVASASIPVVHPIAAVPATEGRDPFSGAQMNAPSARPWPRAVLPQYSSGSGGFNADYSTDRATQTFYPFEPRLPSTPPVTLPEAPARNR